MTGRNRKDGKLRKSRDEVAKRGARIAEVELAHRRIEHLYEVSRLLTRFQSIERTLPEVIAVVARAMTLRSAILILEGGGTSRTIVGLARGESAQGLRAAKVHAQAAYGYLVRSGVDFERSEAQLLELPRPVGPVSSGARCGEDFVLLPLVVNHGPIFGALQVEGAGSMDEHDLVLLNAVVNQLAVAVDRQALISARQSAADTSEQQQRLLADVSAVIGSSLHYRDMTSALARSVVPRFADLFMVDGADADGALERREVLFADERKQRDLSERMRSLASASWKTQGAKVVAAGRSVLVSRMTDPLAERDVDDKEYADALRAAGITSMMSVPLRVRDQTLGVLTFAAAESGRRYSAHDLSLAEEIGRRAAIAIDNARLYEEARQATLARDTLLAVVSHDLRNPLGVIQMALSMLLKRRESEDRRGSRKQLTTIQRSANRMGRLIDDLLATASIDAGRLSVDRRRFDAVRLVSEVLETLQPLAYKKSLRLTSELPDLAVVYADSARLQQVLTNLLDNAIKFSQEGGAITVRAELSGAAVKFRVTDTGEGIAEDALPHVFERFWQARETARFGTGLGLFIVKGIVEAHGGRIWVESKIREGSTFHFTIPVAPQPVDATAARVLRPDKALAPAAVALEPASPKQATELEGLVRELERQGRELDAAIEATRVARELAEHASEFKRDFVSVVSHELRGPLTSLELLLERMQRDRQTPPTPRQHLVIRRMFASVTRLTTVVESLLQHAILQSGTAKIHVEAFDVGPVLEEVLEELTPYAEEKGIEVRVVVAGPVPPLTSDPALVRLVLMNLVANAIKFTERGRVDVGIDCTDGEYHLVVRDSGPGIPAMDRVRIFEPFAQIGDAKQKHVPGMGLGLTLVRDVASALGGQVDLDSEVGRGSTFTVTLPPTPKAPHHPSAPLH